MKIKYQVIFFKPGFSYSIEIGKYLLDSINLNDIENIAKAINNNNRVIDHSNQTVYFKNDMIYYQHYPILEIDGKYFKINYLEEDTKILDVPIAI